MNIQFVTFLDSLGLVIKWTPEGESKPQTLDEARSLAIRMNWTLMSEYTEMIDIESGFIIETVSARVELIDA